MHHCSSDSGSAKPVDLDALEELARRVADALVAHDDILAIDCNPVVIINGNPIVADALLILRD